VAGRQLDGHDVELATWTAAQAEDWLGRWAKKSDADQRVEAQAQAGGFLILFS
jgi:G:T-mismatch repair DNA endonuclease (very short patch repair protein)